MLNRLLLLLTLILLASCRHTSQMEVLTRAEAFLPDEPDSADVLLSGIDVSSLRDGDEAALYALLRPMTNAIQGKALPSDSIIKEAYAFYDRQTRHGSSSDQTVMRRFAKAALYMGDWLAARDSIKACEDCYRTAIRVSEKCKDWHTCYISYQRLAGQIQWSNEEEALTLINKAIEIYGRCHDNVANLLAIYDFKSNYLLQIDYFHNGDYTAALEQANKEYQLAKDSHQTFYENLALCSLAKIYWVKHDYQQALKYARMIESPDSLNESAIYMNNIIAQCYLSCDSLQKAKELYQHPVVHGDKELSYLSARALAELSVKYDHRDSALLYLDSAFTSYEHMYLDVLKAKDDYYQDNLREEKERERLRYKDKIKTWGYGGILLLLLVSGLFVGRVLVLKSRMHKEQNKHLQQELQLRKEQLEAQADALQKKTAAINFLRNSIIERTEAAMKLKDGTPYSKLRPKDWSDVEHLLNDIDNNRIAKIRKRYPDLSSDEIHLCVMVRLGMSNPEIGRVFALAPSTIQHRKLALKKKRFGVTDPDTTLNDCIESL